MGRRLHQVTSSSNRHNRAPLFAPLKYNPSQTTLSLDAISQTFEHQLPGFSRSARATMQKVRRGLATHST
jgi:hypothetical protein